MFTWAAKSVLKNLGRRKYQAAESSRKNAQDLVLAAERSHVPGIRIPLGEQTSEKPVLDAAIALDRNGLVAFAPENGLLSKNVIPNSVINVKSAGRELTMARKLPAEGKSSPTTDHQLRAFPAFDFSHDLGISKQAESGLDFFSSTVGSIHRFLTQTRSVRVLKAAKKSRLLSSLVPRYGTPRRWYGKCGDGPKKPRSESLSECPSVDPPRPGGEVKVRECPPLPKLPKLPKCPPPCPPPPPPPVPECPAPPKCPPPCAPPKKSPSSPHSSPKPKCSIRNISFYGLLQPHYKHAATESGGMPSKSLGHRNPLFLVTHRRISTSKAIFGSKNSGDRSSKCGKKDNESLNKCQTKKSAPNCAKPKKRDTKAKDCTKPKPAENCTPGCAPKPRCPPLPSPPSRQSRVQWSPPACSPPKLVGPSPCPKMSKNPGPRNADAKPACPPPPPLPKPACRPVCLCPCPPPPKLPPGSCPEVPTVDETSQPSCPPPCPPKLPLPCPKDTWCPSEPSCPPKK